MELDLIKDYYDTQVEALERDLTKLSLGPDTFVYDNKVNEIRETYKNNLLERLDKDKLTDDILYYIGVLSESWFLNSFNVVKELSTRSAIYENMIKLKQPNCDQRSPECYRRKFINSRH